jgi:nitroreductase
MDFVGLAKARRTVHEFTDAKLDEGVLRTAVELAAFAPNHRATRPWRLFRVGPIARGALARLAAESKAGKNGTPVTADLLEKTQRKFLTPAELIVLGQVRSQDPERSKEDYAAVACAVQNMQLYLWSLGWGSKWGTGATLKSPDAYRILGVDETQIELVGYFWIGKPALWPAVPAKARPEDILAHVP